MALAVVALDRSSERELAARGLADSKSFGAGTEAVEQRAQLARAIELVAIVWAVELVPPEEIDRWTLRGQLNALEREVAMRLLGRVRARADDRIVCDGATLFSPLCARFSRLVAKDRAESAHPAVAAASILAKDARDSAFAVIAGRYAGEFGPIRGGGYLNPPTRAFLAAYEARYGGLPPEARKSWGGAKEVGVSGPS